MPNANTIGLIFGLIMILILVLGALWGFLAGLKRELKCLAVFVVVLSLSWIIFEANASIDKEVIFGLSGIVNGILGTPAELQTWREISLYFGQNSLGLKETLIEGTETYNLFMGIVSMVVRGGYLILGTVLAMGLSGVIRLISHLGELIIRTVRCQKQKAEKKIAQMNEETKKPKRLALGNRFFGAGVGFLKSCLIVILICAPVAGIVSVVSNVEDETVDEIEQITMGAPADGTMIDWIFEAVWALDDNVFVEMIQSTEVVFGKSLSDSIFDTSFYIETDDDVVYLREELIKLIDIVNRVLPTYDQKQKIPFDIWKLSDEELDGLFDILAESKLVQSAIPIAFEYAGQMDSIQVMLQEAGLRNLNSFVQEVDWDKDLVPLLKTIKKALRVVNLNEELNIMDLNSDTLRDLINTIGATTFFQKLMPIVIDISLSLSIIENFTGEIENISGNSISFDWKDELINLIDVYEILQELNIDIKNVNLQWLINLVDDEESFAIVKQAIAELTSGELFGKVLIPILDQAIEHQIEVQGLDEFKNLLSIIKMESTDWNHDLPIVLEMVGLLSKIGVIGNNIKLNEYEAMHDLVDAFFELVILSDKVKVSVDTVDLKTLIIEAALRQFQFLDIGEIEFELIELREEIDWVQEKANIHKLINTFKNFAQTAKNLQGIELISIANFAELNFNILLDSNQFWDDVMDLLDSVVDSKLVMSLLPHTFEKFISPIIFNLNGEIGELGLFDDITSKNIVAELYNLVYLALDLKALGLFDVEARNTLEYDLGALAYHSLSGFYESEYFTYQPQADDLALVDIVERIFASSLLRGREGRLIRVILASALNVNVSIDELMSINYSASGSTSEKQILVEGINTLRPILEDPEFAIFKTDTATGIRSLNTAYFLDKEHLSMVFDTIETLFKSQIITYLLPEVYNQLFVSKGIIPADWAEILKVQSTYLGLTEGITADELNEDVLSIIKALKEIVEFGVLDILDSEKQRDVRIDGLGLIVADLIDVVVGLNIIDDKIGTVVFKLLEDNAVEMDTTLLVNLDWDKELLHVREILLDVQELLVLCGFTTYGDILTFMTTSPLNIAKFYNTMTIYLVGTISLELYNSQILHEIAYEFLINKFLGNNTNFNTMLHLDNYDSELFKQDLLILSDITYQLIISNLTPIIGSFIFPTTYNGVYDVDLGKASIAYLLEDILSLRIVNLNLYSLTETLFTKMGFSYNYADLLGVRLVYDLNFDVPSVWGHQEDMLNAFSQYNLSLTEKDLFYKGDAIKVREFYLALLPIFNGSEFPITDTAKLKGFMAAFNTDVINAYKQSEKLNTYALAIADALDIFSEMTIGKATLTPLVEIIDKKNISFGGTKLSSMLEFRTEFTKDDMLGDISILAQVIRDAVGFDLINILLRDADIKWVTNTLSAQSLIENLFSVKFLDANFEAIFNIVVSMMSSGTGKINLASDVALASDGQKIAKAYPYLADILQNTLGINKLSTIKILQINFAKFLVTEPALNVVYAVREIITITILEAVIPDLFALMQNSNLHVTFKELMDLSDITSGEVLEAVQDITYPLEELLKLNVLDLLQKQNISLGEINKLPGIVEDILQNKYITTKHATLLEIARILVGLETTAFNAYNVDWDREVTYLVGAIQDVTDIIENCGFETANDIIRLINNPANGKQYLTIANVEKVISAIRNLISSKIIEGLGLGFYQYKLLPSMQPNLNSALYNLIKIDDIYTGEKLFDDVELLLQMLETFIDGDLIKIVAEDYEIDYVGITPDVQSIINNIFNMQYLSDKIAYLYDYITLIIPSININYIDYLDINLASDGVLVSEAYEMIAPLLDTDFNPYQTLSSFKQEGLKFNFGGALEEDFIKAIEGLKLINDTTLVTKNNVIVIDILNKTYSSLDTTNLYAAIIKELLNTPLENGQYKLVSEILHDDLNSIFDFYVLELEGGLLDMLRDIQNYDITQSLLPTEVEVIQGMLDLRFLVELKGQAILELILNSFGISEHLDYSTLTYVNEAEVLKNIIAVLPDVYKEIGCKSYIDFLNFYNNTITSLQNNQFNFRTILTEGNFTNMITILECLENSEIVKQAAIPLYQAICYPLFEQTNNNELIEFIHIDETIYTNEMFIKDYISLIDALKVLDDFGIYNIMFNNEKINWSKVEVVETLINATLGSQLYQYKEEQLIKAIVNTMSKIDANINLINRDVIKLAQDKDLLIEAYKALIPVLTVKSFPWNTLSDFTQKVTIYLQDYANKEIAYSLIDTLSILNETTLNKGTLPYTTNLIKLIFNNSYINNILSYQTRGLTEADIVDDLRRLLEDGGALELLVDANFIDLLYGKDINIILPNTYEAIIRDIWDLNLLDGQYAEVIKFVGTIFGVDLNQIDTNIVNADLDEELIISLMKDILILLENNDFATISAINLLFKLQIDIRNYFTVDNVRSLTNIGKDLISLTAFEATLPAFINNFVNNKVVPNARALFILDENYTYADLRNDYNNHIYDTINDLLDFGIIGILRYNDTIDWDKQKVNGIYYGSAILEELLSLEYLEAKKHTLYQVFMQNILPGVNVDAIVPIKEIDNFTAAYEQLLPLLLSDEWTYNTYSEILRFNMQTFDAKKLLTRTNTDSLISALREFNDSVLLEEMIGPFFEQLSNNLVSWIDFSIVTDANAELAEYDRLLNIASALNNIGYIQGDYSAIDTEQLANLIDMILGNETLTPKIEGLMCITDEGECIKMLYQAGLLPSFEGIEPDINSVEEDKWYEEIVILSNIIHSLGAFSTENGNIDLPNIMTTMLHSSDVEALEETLTYLNESILYRNILYRALYDSNTGSLANYTTSWFTTQKDGAMNDEWDEEVIILARLLATINTLGGVETLDIDNYQTIEKGYESGNAATSEPYELTVGGVDAGLRQIYQLLIVSKTYNIDSIKDGMELYLDITTE